MLPNFTYVVLFLPTFTIWYHFTMCVIYLVRNFVYIKMLKVLNSRFKSTYFESNYANLFTSRGFRYRPGLISAMEPEAWSWSAKVVIILKLLSSRSALIIWGRCSSWSVVIILKHRNHPGASWSSGVACFALERRVHPGAPW